MSRYEDGLPFEEFIQALSSQLDRAQTALAMKARAGLPLTFAVRDITIDLRAHLSMVESQVRIMPAGPRDGEASMVHIAFTTITRPMVLENTLQIEQDDQSLQEVLGEDVSEEERRRLEWAGIRTVSQLRQLEREGSEHVIEQIAQVPATRLRAALQRASQPQIQRVVPEEGGRLRIEGRNLVGPGGPRVHLESSALPRLATSGEPGLAAIGLAVTPPPRLELPVLHATARELIVEVPAHAHGRLSIETGPGLAVATELALDGEGAAADGALGGPR